jgi:hypothetical protein
VDDSSHALEDYADKEAVAVVFTCNHCPYAQAWEEDRPCRVHHKVEVSLL